MHSPFRTTAAAWFLTAAVAPFAAADSTLSARIIDDASARPLAARVAVANPDGREIEIAGPPHAHVRQLGRRWCYVDGAFTVVVPASGVVIEIRRGLETRPLSETIPPASNGGPLQRTFRLRRWTDLYALGNVSGDIHAHAPAPREAALQMRAEDLRVVNLLTLGGQDFPANGCFSGRLDEASSDGYDISVGQEVQDWQAGHLTLVGLRTQIPDYPRPGGTLEYWRSDPHWDLGRALRAAREQNAVVSWSHFENLPGSQSPVAVALGLVDALELITWGDPTQLPAHWGPWNDSGFSQAEFTVMRGVDLYYQYLNAGFRLPIAAGTDKLGEDVPLGSNRLYVPAKRPLGHASWLEGVRAGTGFVTNGPLLEFDVDGHRPGEVVDFHASAHVTARVTARSVLPFTTLELVSNGRALARRVVPIPANPPLDGVYSMSIEASVDLEHSAWIAARVTDDPDLNPRVLPRGASVFAHSNPVYFLRDGARVREEAALAYLRRYVRGLQHWLATRPTFTYEADRQSAERDAAETLRVYEAR